eukprot:m.190378 g.190378  ORF g.190378 m.190378 type:complete len:366 (-) comp18229_c0_seq1:130-1227(-)
MWSAVHFWSSVCALRSAPTLINAASISSLSSSAHLCRGVYPSLFRQLTLPPSSMSTSSSSASLSLKARQISQSSGGASCSDLLACCGASPAVPSCSSISMAAFIICSKLMAPSPSWSAASPSSSCSSPSPSSSPCSSSSNMSPVGKPRFPPRLMPAGTPRTGRSPSFSAAASPALPVAKANSFRAAADASRATLRRSSVSGADCTGEDGTSSGCACLMASRYDGRGSFFPLTSNSTDTLLARRSAIGCNAVLADAADADVSASVKLPSPLDVDDALGRGESSLSSEDDDDFDFDFRRLDLRSSFFLNDSCRLTALASSFLALASAFCCSLATRLASFSACLRSFSAPLASLSAMTEVTHVLCVVV